MVQTSDADRVAILHDLASAFIDTVRAAKQVGTIDTRLDRGALHVLLNAALDENTRLSDLAGSCHLDLSTVSRAVKALELDGLVVRSVDPNDRRASRIEATAAGRNVLTELRTQHVGALDAAVTRWSTSDLDTLTRLLVRLADDLGHAVRTVRRLPTSDPPGVPTTTDPHTPTSQTILETA
ncbi:MAG: MarR family winged helix-turn-helix transcriptional regulator [Actinomycetes bacterium]